MLDKANWFAEVKYKSFESNSLLGATNQLNHWLKNHAVNILNIETITNTSGQIWVSGGTVSTDALGVRLWYQEEQPAAKAKPVNPLKAVNKDLEEILKHARQRATDREK